MKAKEKRNYLEEEADKIEELSEEVKIDEGEVQEKSSEPKKTKKKRFLARLRKAWKRVVGCMRCCTSIQDEESHEGLPEPSWVNIVDNKANESSKEMEKEEKNKNIKATDQEAELDIDRVVEQEIQAEYQHHLDLIHSLEDQYIQYYGEELERASCEVPAPNHISSGGNENKPTVNTTEERDVCLEETPEELYVTMKTSQSSSNEETSDYCSAEEDTPLELYKSTKTSQSCTNHDEEPTTSNICLEEPNQSAHETCGTVPLTLECFTFHQKLGEGGFGRVYLAKDVIRNECVAIKVSDKRNFTEKGYSFAERYVLQLSHESPYLIHGLAAFHTLNFVYYVMEVTTRGTLRDFMQKRKNFTLPSDTIKFIITEIISGTEFLHNNGILHRDLKPANILLATEGHIKITDFGLAVMGVYERTKEQRKGTPGYAAPELVMGVEYGRGVDYFSIGVIMYELFTRRRPFPGRSPREVEYAVIHHTPRYPTSLTHVIVNLLQGLLSKNQFQRFGIKADVRSHPYFHDVNWEDVEARRVAPPEIMTATAVDLNVNYTLPYGEPLNSIRAIHQKIFNKFNFVCAEWSRHYHPVIVETESLNGPTRSFKKKEN